MNLLKPKNTSFVILIFIATIMCCNAQEGKVTINQSSEITKLIKLKKEINSSDEVNKRYKIQIYSGTLSKAEAVKMKFRNSFNKWSSTMVYETPNYKIWIGNFRNRLEADRALKEIKRKFPTAFKFKPKKEK